MNSRYLKPSTPPSNLNDDESISEISFEGSSGQTAGSKSSAISTASAASISAGRATASVAAQVATLDASTGSDFHDDSQLEFSAILGAPTTPSPELNEIRKFMTEYTLCAMCDTKLEIRHEINMNDLKVKEEAHCPSCGIRVRSKHHLMH